MDAKQMLNEALDHFQENNESPGGAWAFDDECQSLGLDYRSRDKCKFWLDLDRDGTVTILWKPVGADSPNVFKFRSRSSARPRSSTS